MQQLIDQLMAKRGINAELAKGILTTIKEFIEENFPAFGNSLDGILVQNAVQEQSTILPNDKKERALY